MIERDIKTKITEQNFSLDSNIILFKGDGRIDFKLIIEDKRYKYDNVYIPTYYNFTIISPNSKEPLNTEKDIYNNNILVLSFTKDMIDELEEVGIYYIQTQLYDNDNNCIILPPFNIEIKDCIAENGDIYGIVGKVGIGVVNICSIK